MRVRRRILVPGPALASAAPAAASVAFGWLVTGWLAPASMIPPAPLPGSVAHARPQQQQQQEVTWMADRRRLDDQEAARRRRAWLQQRHSQARELVVVLLRHAPEAEVARVLDQLPAGELQRLAGLLADAAELHHDQDVAPPGRAGSSMAAPTRP